jgi:hypothetical protein
MLILQNGLFRLIQAVQVSCRLCVQILSLRNSSNSASICKSTLQHLNRLSACNSQAGDLWFSERIVYADLDCCMPLACRYLSLAWPMELDLAFFSTAIPLPDSHS